MTLLRTLLAAALLAAAPLAAAAATILDTRDPGTASYFNLISTVTTNQSRLGQSFTIATPVSDVAVTTQFISFSGGVDVLAQLVRGAGVGGSVLGGVRLTATAAEVAGRTLALRTADFSALGTLMAGTYTFVVSGTGAFAGGAAGVDTPGTDSFGPAGVFDFRTNRAREFGITVTATPIPLPASGLLLLGAAAALAGLRRRARG